MRRWPMRCALCLGNARRAGCGIGLDSVWILQSRADHADWQAETTGAARPGRAFLDLAVQALPARSEKALVSALADMYMQGGVDSQGQGDHRGAVWAWFLGDDDQPDQQGAGRHAGTICPAPAGARNCHARNAVAYQRQQV